MYSPSPFHSHTLEHWSTSSLFNSTRASCRRILSFFNRHYFSLYSITKLQKRPFTKVFQTKTKRFFNLYSFYEDRGTAGGAGLVFRACEFLNIPSQAIDKTQEEVKEWLHKEEQLFPLKTKKQTTPKKKVIKQEEKKEGLKKDWIEFSGFSEICTKYNYKKCPFKVTDDTNDKIYIKCQACDKIICIEKTGKNIAFFLLIEPYF